MYSYMQVRPFNLKEHKVIRDLNPDDMNKLISISGMVTRSSAIIPDPRYIFCSSNADTDYQPHSW